MSGRTTRTLAAAFAAAALILLSFGSRPALAQGLHAGISISELTDVPGLESRRGLVIGASLSFLEFGALAVSPQIVYVQKGARLASATENGIDDIRIDWFEVPVLVEFGGYVFNSPLRPSIHVGPYFGIRSGCSFGFEDGGDRSEECSFAGLQEAGIDGAFEDSDFGWTAGASLELYAGTIGNLSVEARYSASFSDIMRQGSVTEAKTRSWILTAGWRPTVR